MSHEGDDKLRANVEAALDENVIALAELDEGTTAIVTRWLVVAEVQDLGADTKSISFIGSESVTTWDAQGMLHYALDTASKGVRE